MSTKSISQRSTSTVSSTNSTSPTVVVKRNRKKTVPVTTTISGIKKSITSTTNSNGISDDNNRYYRFRKSIVHEKTEAKVYGMCQVCIAQRAMVSFVKVTDPIIITAVKDGRIVITDSQASILRTVDISAGKEGRIVLNCVSAIIHKTFPINVGNDELISLVVGSNDGFVRIYHIENNKSKKPQTSGFYDLSPSKRESASILTCTIFVPYASVIADEAPNEVAIAAGSIDGYIYIWSGTDHKTYTLKHSINVNASMTGIIIDRSISSKNISIRSIASFCPGSAPVILSGDSNGIVRVWDLQEGKEREGDPLVLVQKKDSSRGDGALVSIYSPTIASGYCTANNDTSDTIIVTAGVDMNIIIWSYNHFEKIRKLKCDYVSTSIYISCLYDTNNPMIAATSDEVVTLWMLSSAHEVRRVDMHKIKSCAVTPIGTYKDALLITVNDDQTTNFINFGAGEVILHAKRGHSKRMKTSTTGRMTVNTSPDSPGIPVVGASGSFKKEEKLLDRITSQLNKSYHTSICTNAIRWDVERVKQQQRSMMAKIDKRKSYTNVAARHGYKVDTNQFDHPLLLSIDNLIDDKIKLWYIDPSFNAKYNDQYVTISELSNRFNENLDKLELLSVNNSLERDYVTLTRNYSSISRARGRKDSIDRSAVGTTASGGGGGGGYSRYRTSSAATDDSTQRQHSIEHDKHNYAVLWSLSRSSSMHNANSTMKSTYIELIGHRDIVTTMCLVDSYDKVGYDTIITGAIDGTMKRWNMSTRRELSSIDAHVATKADDAAGVIVMKSVYLIDNDASDGSDDIDATMSDTTGMYGMSKRWHVVVSTGADKTIKVWGLDDDESDAMYLKYTMKFAGSITCIAFASRSASTSSTSSSSSSSGSSSYNGDVKDLILAGSTDKKIRIFLWSNDTAEVIMVIDNHSTVNSIYAYQQHGMSWFCTGSENGVIKLWDLMYVYNSDNKIKLLREFKYSDSICASSNSHDNSSSSSGSSHACEPIICVAVAVSDDAGSGREPCVYAMDKEGSITLWDTYFACSKAVLSPQCMRDEFKIDLQAIQRPNKADVDDDDDDDDTTAAIASSTNYTSGYSNSSRVSRMNKKNIDKWSRISLQVAKYGAAKVFRENCYLFWLALELREPDFIQMFLLQYPTAVTTDYSYWLSCSNSSTGSIVGNTGIGVGNSSSSVGNSYITGQSDNDVKLGNSCYYCSDISDITSIFKRKTVKTNRDSSSLLSKALFRKDLSSVRVILECWLSLFASLGDVNHDDSTLYTHHYSISKRFHKNDYYELAQQYPVEFNLFISRLRAINSHRCVKHSFETKLKAGEVLVRGCTDTTHAQSVWINNTTSSKLMQPLRYRKGIGKKNESNPVIAQYLPINHTADLAMLKCYCDVSAVLDVVDIFDNDVGIRSLQFAWQQFGRDVHIKSMVIYLIFVMFYTASCYVFSQYNDGTKHSRVLDDILGYNNNKVMQYIGWGSQPLLGMFSMYFLRLEYLQAKYNKHTLLRHMQDAWNAADLISQLIVLIGICLHVLFQQETTVSRCVLSIATIFIWVKILYFLRAFESTGRLVSIVFVIGVEIRYFLLLLCIFIFGFSFAFWQLEHTNPYLSYITIQSSIQHLFESMLGNLTVDFQNSSAKEFSTALFVLYAVTVIILLLNLLIALMNTYYNSIYGKGLAQWRYEQAKIILDQAFLIPKHILHPPNPVYFPETIHVLRRVADIEQEKVTLLKDVNRTDDNASLASYSNSYGYDSVNGSNRSIEEKLTLLDKRIDKFNNKVDTIDRKIDMLLLLHFYPNDIDKQQIGVLDILEQEKSKLSKFKQSQGLAMLAPVTTVVTHVDHNSNANEDRHDDDDDGNNRSSSDDDDDDGKSTLYDDGSVYDAHGRGHDRHTDGDSMKYFGMDAVEALAYHDEDAMDAMDAMDEDDVTEDEGDGDVGDVTEDEGDVDVGDVVNGSMIEEEDESPYVVADMSSSVSLAVQEELPYTEVNDDFDIDFISNYMSE